MPDIEESTNFVREGREVLAERLDNEKYRYFLPTGKGEQYINKLGSGKYFVGLYSAANGVGKTATQLNFWANLFWPCENEFFQQNLLIDWPYGRSGRFVCPPQTAKMLNKQIEEWFPKGRYKRKKMGKNYFSYYQTDTGWDFDIMTYEQDSSEFESETLGFIWFDEPPPEDIYKACVARTRKGAIIAITATMLKGSAWMYDQIISKSNNKDYSKGRRFYIEADIESACEDHGTRGFLKHEHILNIVSQYDEDEKQARVYGRPQHLIGLVFKMWNRNVHILKPFQITKEDFVVIHALDTHPRRPDAATWIAIDRNNTKYVIKEMDLTGGTEEAAQRIKEANSEYRIIANILEPAAYISDHHKEKERIKSIADDYQQYGIKYQPATKYRSQSDQFIMDSLYFQSSGNSVVIPPSLYYFDTCPKSIWEMEHWRWDEWSGKTAQNKGPKEMKIDKDDHFIENVGRILIRKDRFTEMEKSIIDLGFRDNSRPGDPY